MILGLVGDTSAVDIDLLRALDIVEDVKRIQEPYKNANRKFHVVQTFSHTRQNHPRFYLGCKAENRFT